MLRACLAAVLAAAVSVPALAHHGKDFLLVESYEVPHPGDLYALADGEYARDAGVEEAALEPAVLLGLAPRVAGEVHAHFVKDDEARSFGYESLAPSLHAQLTDPHGDAPLNVGLAAEYEFGHRDHADAFEGRLVLERGFGPVKLALNGIVSRAARDDALGYAAGLRYEASEALAFGAEALGSFDEHRHEGLLGVYLEPAERLTVKLGAGAKLGGDGPDVSARLGLVLRY